MNIRLATADEVDSLVEFNQAMAIETEDKRLDADTLKQGVSAVFSDDRKGFYVVAEVDGKIAGGLMITYEWSDWRNGWFWWIQSVYVVPEWRGKSVYRRLYEFVLQMAEENGDVRGFRLYVEHDNEAARRVYEKLGMQQSHYLMYEHEK